MSELHVSGGANIVEQSGSKLVRLASYENPEKILVNELAKFFREIGFSSAFPNFGNINIGAVHPFAMLLAQEVVGGAADITNIFPSITVSDFTENEAQSVLAKNEQQMMIDATIVSRFKAARDKVFISDEALGILETSTENNAKILGIRNTYIASHSLDFDIWSDNKEVTSFIYDMTKHFITSHVKELHNLGVDITGDLNGRRTGDIDLSYGKLLFNSSLRASASTIESILTVNIEVGEIGSIDTITLPTHHNP